MIVRTIPKPVTLGRPPHAASTPAERGKYLATIGQCRECHTFSDDPSSLDPARLFGGGAMFKDPGQNDKEIFTANITPDPSGIAHYNEEMFLQMMRTGQVGGKVLNPIMPTGFFRNMTDDDLKDIFAYLKTLAPVKHRVSNTDPPTKCDFCGQNHGLGEYNKAK
jgi:hypothetical protein